MRSCEGYERCPRRKRLLRQLDLVVSVVYERMYGGLESSNEGFVVEAAWVCRQAGGGVSRFNGDEGYIATGSDSDAVVGSSDGYDQASWSLCLSVR